jgi:hypothetical protein
MDKKEKISQYKNRQTNMTEDDKLEEKRIRNLKDRERYANNSEAKAKKKYRTYKSIAYSFIDMEKEEHLEELLGLLKNKLNNK